MKKKTVVLLIVIFATVIGGCGPRETVVPNLGNAENSLFTPDGRLIITGSKIWEIKQSEKEYEAHVLSGDLSCDFTGIVHYKDHLFAVCSNDQEGEAWLVRASLDDLEFTKIYQLNGFTIANGMAIDESGRLYIADETLINTQGKIVRLSLTNDAEPEVIESSCVQKNVSKF